MSQNLTRSLIKSLIDTLIAIEFSTETIVDEDVAVEILEQISAELQTLSALDKATLVNEISHLSQQYPKEFHEFVKSLPENLGI
jgi:hypothetical protein